MYSQENIENIVSKFFALASKGIKINSIYLFGSYAKGNEREESDIDLAIVSDEFEGSRFDDSRRLSKYVIETSSDLEVHPFKTSDFNEGNPFVKEILKTGIRLV